MDNRPGYKTLHLARPTTAERTPQRTEPAGSRMNSVENRIHGGFPAVREVRPRANRSCRSYGFAFTARPAPTLGRRCRRSGRRRVGLILVVGEQCLARNL